MIFDIPAKRYKNFLIDYENKALLCHGLFKTVFLNCYTVTVKRDCSQW